jgi:hypothetical protein
MMKMGYKQSFLSKGHAKVRKNNPNAKRAGA